LRIFITADPFLPVPPRLYGGIERVIDLLIEGLVARGHDVTLFAHRDSSPACELVAYPRRGSRLVDSTVHAALIAREASRRKPDIIQSFGRLAYLLPLLPAAIPKVMSYQREVTPRTVSRALALSRRTLSFTGCSLNLIAPVRHIGEWRVIYNAVSTETFSFSERVAPDAPLVFLGRVEHIKGAHVAIEVAQRTERRLVIAGNVPDEPQHQAYFRERIQPHVDGRSVTYVGPVDDEAKRELLGSAAALLMPVLWDEPFGIVMAEALACGTPVIGLARGAVPEVVLHGSTGVVCADADAMVAAIPGLQSLSRAACRRDAEARFSRSALVDAYESLFHDRLDPAHVSAALQPTSHV
jgi:glycosyltransferase involved in cell wall biosynthesis